MPKELVKQPNDLYAIFSTIEDDFVIWGMTKEQALDATIAMSNKEQGHILMEEADLDIANDYEMEDGATGSKRWNKSLEAMAAHQGIEAVEQTLKTLSIDNYEIQPYLYEISEGLEEDRAAFAM